MKVIFKQGLAELTGRLNAPVKPDALDSGGGDSFRTLLRDLSPFNSQSPDKTKDLAHSQNGPPGQKLNDSGPMASYRPAPAEMMVPSVPRLNGDSGGDNDPLGGVKTPTLLEAKRVRSPNPYKEFSGDERVSEVQKVVSNFGLKYGIDPSLAMAVAETESSFNPNAVSSDGHASKGLFQLLDKTGKDMMGRLSSDFESLASSKKYDPFNPELNSELGISYLRYLHDLFNREAKLPNGNITVPAANSSSLEKLAVAAYNAGEGRVSGAQASAKKAGRNPSEYDQVEPYLPESTQQYVKKVDLARARFAGPDPDIENS